MSKRRRVTDIPPNVKDVYEMHAATTERHETESDGPAVVSVNIGMPRDDGSFREGLLILDAVTFVAELEPKEHTLSAVPSDPDTPANAGQVVMIPQTHVFFAGGAITVSEYIGEIRDMIAGAPPPEPDDLALGIENMRKLRAGEIKPE